MRKRLHQIAVTRVVALWQVCASAEHGFEMNTFEDDGSRRLVQNQFPALYRRLVEAEVPCAAITTEISTQSRSSTSNDDRSTAPGWATCTGSPQPFCIAGKQHNASYIRFTRPLSTRCYLPHTTAQHPTEGFAIQHIFKLGSASVISRNLESSGDTINASFFKLHTEQFGATNCARQRS